MKKQLGILTALALLLCGITAHAENNSAEPASGGIDYLW